MRNRLFVLVAPFLFSCIGDGDVDAANLIACGAYDSSTHICDVRDGNLYRIAEMPDGKMWMAENLKYVPLSGLSKCYRDKPENCEVYGRLYSWDNRANLCPDGWKIPNMKSDWEPLEDEVGAGVLDERLKATNGWDSYDNGKNGNGLDSYKFTVLPGGAYSVRYYANEDIFNDSAICNESENFNDWGNNGAESLGRIAVFMSSSDQSKWIISNEPALRFCVASNALVSVRCVREN